MAFDPGFTKNLWQSLVRGGALVVLTLALTWAVGVFSDRYTSAQAGIDRARTNERFDRLETRMSAHGAKPGHDSQLILNASREEKISYVIRNQDRILKALDGIKTDFRELAVRAHDHDDF